MRLSMWILADWLKKYEPEIKIEDGRCTLRNVRLLTPDNRTSRTAVYLEKINSQKIMCFNGHDILILHSDDIHEVFNQILDAFDYYNEWEADVCDLISSGGSIQALLQAGNRLLNGFLILADATFYMRETNGPEEILDSNPPLKEAVSNRLLPLNTLLRINRDSFIRMPVSQTYVEDIPELNVAAPTTNIYTRNGHRGWLISIRPDNSFTKGMFDLQNRLASFINLWIENHADQEKQLEKSGIFTEIIEGISADPLQVQKRLEPFQWYKEDTKILYVIQARRNEEPVYSVLESQISHLSNALFLVKYQGYLLCIVNTALLMDTKQFDSKLAKILRSCQCRAGRSSPFQDLMHLKEQYKTARYAADISPCGMITDFRSAAADYFIHEIHTNAELPALHPALAILKKHDKRVGSALYRTLKIFLQSGCSYAETAKILYIHRSTLVYRINKILELTEINLKDFKERYYLETSYLLDKDGEAL